jgi:organic radical activating enzyme
MENKFSIKTKTSCPLKWCWSTLYLNTGKTASCHRTAHGTINIDNFNSFHNIPVKIKDREEMLSGHWPTNSCQYCRLIEENGKTSDRIRHNSIPYDAPNEFKIDQQATIVTPTILEVYFNNLCNQACLYCNPELSSTLAAEYKKFGNFQKYNVKLISVENKYETLVPMFWKWLDGNYQHLRQLHILGGEPFFQQEFDTLIEKLSNLKNPECKILVITNLKVSRSKLEQTVHSIKDLLAKRKIKDFTFVCSIDSWGPEQEYVRWGINLDQWEDNFLYLCEQKWLTLQINQTISLLAIKSMPLLLEKLKKWRQKHTIGHWFSEVSPGPSYLKLDVLGGNLFEEDFKKIINLMPADTEEEKLAVEYMSDIFRTAQNAEPNSEKIRDLITFLDEKDRRRGTCWQETFPWLVDFKKHY